MLQSTEVKNSNAMELESLKRQIAYLEKKQGEDRQTGNGSACASGIIHGKRKTTR
jgi:hypothetical protein